MSSCLPCLLCWRHGMGWLLYPAWRVFPSLPWPFLPPLTPCVPTHCTYHLLTVLKRLTTSTTIMLKLMETCTSGWLAYGLMKLVMVCEVFGRHLRSRHYTLHSITVCRVHIWQLVRPVRLGSSYCLGLVAAGQFNFCSCSQSCMTFIIFLDNPGVVSAFHT